MVKQSLVSFVPSITAPFYVAVYCVFPFNIVFCNLSTNKFKNGLKQISWLQFKTFDLFRYEQLFQLLTIFTFSDAIELTAIYYDLLIAVFPGHYSIPPTPSLPSSSCSEGMSFQARPRLVTLQHIVFADVFKHV